MGEEICRHGLSAFRPARTGPGNAFSSCTQWTVRPMAALRRLSVYAMLDGRRGQEPCQDIVDTKKMEGGIIALAHRRFVRKDGDNTTLVLSIKASRR